MTSKLLCFFSCSGLSNWSSICLFHLLQFSLILACLSKTVSSVHPSSGHFSCFFCSMRYCFFLDVVTFCVYHLLHLLSDRIYLRKEKDQERPFQLSHFWHHVSFFIWLEGFFGASLGNNLSLCFWEVACETVHCICCHNGLRSVFALCPYRNSYCGISSAFRRFY